LIRDSIKRPQLVGLPAVMENRFSVFCNDSHGSVYYLKDNKTGPRTSLHTTDKILANELVIACNEAVCEAALNLQNARLYLISGCSGTKPGVPELFPMKVKI
jgi:hypothetical protein